MAHGKVFILGAGASYFDTSENEFPIPLAAEFFTSKYINEFWPDNKYYWSKPFQDSEISKILTTYFGVRWKTFKNGKIDIKTNINIEEVYSFIDTFNETLGAHAPNNGMLNLAKIELLDYIDQVVRYCAWGMPTKGLYKYIRKLITPQDSIVCLNWDLLIDEELKKNSVGRSLLESQRYLVNPIERMERSHIDYDELAMEELHKGHLIKLHGALNLYVCENEKCHYFHNPYIYGTRKEMGELWQCGSCGSRISMMIVPPHVHKSLSQRRILKLQANVTREILSIADEIIIIGYAFPFFDFDTATIFRSLRADPYDQSSGEDWFANITLVNPSVRDSAYVNRVKDLFGINNPISFYNQDIEFKTFECCAAFMKSYKK